MADIVYNTGKARALAGLLVSGTTNLAAALVVTSKAGAADPDLATMADIDAVGTVAFHPNRQTLTAVTVTTDNANDRVNIDCADITWPAAAGVVALAMIVYDKTTDTNDGTRVPLSFHDTNFGAGVPLDGGLVVSIADLLRQL